MSYIDRPFNETELIDPDGEIYELGEMAAITGEVGHAVESDDDIIEEGEPSDSGHPMGDPDFDDEDYTDEELEDLFGDDMDDEG